MTAPLHHLFEKKVWLMKSCVCQSPVASSFQWTPETPRRPTRGAASVMNCIVNHFCSLAHLFKNGQLFNCYISTVSVNIYVYSTLSSTDVNDSYHIRKLWTLKTNNNGLHFLRYRLCSKPEANSEVQSRAEQTANSNFPFIFSTSKLRTEFCVWFKIDLKTS